MKILFNGAYTINSAGDDAALEALLSLLRGRGGEQDVQATVLSRHASPAFDQAFGVTTIANLEYPTKEASTARWLQGFNFGDAPETLVSLAGHFENTDLVVLGAGNFLNENSFGLFRGMLPRFCVSAFLAQLTNTPCLLYGLSASQLSSPLARGMAEWLLRTATHVTFRERQSVDLLCAAGVELPEAAEILPDPVLASRCASEDQVAGVLARNGIESRSDRPRLAIGLRCLDHLGGAVQRRFSASLKFACDRWTAAGGELLFVPQCTYEADRPVADDRNAAAELIASLADPRRALQVRSHCWPWEIEGLYGVCEMAVCVRLHAGVFACKRGIPTLAFGYEPKVEGFWRSLELEEYCLPLEITPADLWQRIEAARTAFPRSRMQERVTRLRDGCRRYAEIVQQLAAESGRRRAA